MQTKHAFVSTFTAIPLVQILCLAIQCESSGRLKARIGSPLNVDRIRNGGYRVTNAALDSVVIAEHI